jgi:hypothetical protein
VCVFITAVPISKLFAGGLGDGHNRGFAGGLGDGHNRGFAMRER